MNYNASESVFNCVFGNEPGNLQRSCTIAYGFCGQKLNGSASRFSTTDNPNTITLDLPVLKDETYCYLVTASNNETTVHVEGNFTVKSKL